MPSTSSSSSIPSSSSPSSESSSSKSSESSSSISSDSSSSSSSSSFSSLSSDSSSSFSSFSSSSSSFYDYVTVLPPLDINYVRPYAQRNQFFNGYYCMDPSLSLIGDWANNSWLSCALDRYNYKFNVDFGTPQTIERIYYENAHDRGGATENGIRYVDIYGTNSSQAFINFEYSNTTNLTLLWSGEFAIHTRENISDPHYINLSNTTAYQYYVLRILNSWNGNAGMGLRRIEFQRRIT